MEPEQLQKFNSRLNQWVSNQGFWFQVRYSMAGSGVRGRAMFHLLRMAFRLGVFLALVMVGLWVYLVKRSDSVGFREGVRSGLERGLSAASMEMRGLQRTQGQMEISRFAAEGGSGTFFNSLEVRNLRCRMGLLDGLWGVWKPGTISMASLDVDLRAGADDAESARKFAEAVFRDPTRVEVDAFEVGDATIRWGFSERTQGMIESSELKIQRTGTGWRMSFRGGWFHQNWLKKLEIVNLVVNCGPDGLEFEKAQFRRGKGKVDFSGLRVTSGERPQVRGIAKVRQLELEDSLPPALRTFIEGTLSADLQVSGSTNSSDGVGFAGQVVMAGDDMISLRNRFHLLEALSVVDYSRNYHRVDFREGSFDMKTSAGGMELSSIRLKAEDLFTLEGNVSVRLPTDEEVQQAISTGTGLEVSPLFASEDQMNEDAEGNQSDAEFTLKRAGQEARRIQETLKNASSLSVFDRLNLSIEARRLQAQASERLSRMLRYSGALRITIPGDAFERAPRLQELYPVDSGTGRISIDVPIEGHLYELTLKQAEEVYQRRQR